MLDEEWLRTLEFETIGGTITGLTGIGTQWLVFNYRCADGELKVAKYPNRPHLGWCIREIPPQLTAKPAYDVDRLNEKLLRLLGNSEFDSMVGGYDHLYAAIMSTLHGSMSATPDAPVEGLLQGWLKLARSETLAKSLAFVVHTPGMLRRLQDLAFLDLKTSDPAEIILVNPMVSLIEDTRVNLVRWAKYTLMLIEQCSPPEGTDPDKLTWNPLYVWGGAVLDDFLTADEMPRAIEFIIENFGRLSERPDAQLLRGQIFGLLNVLVQILSEEQVSRLARFCALAGFSFEVVDTTGRTVIRGEDPAFTEPLSPAERAQKSLDAARADVKFVAGGKRLPKLPDPSAVPPFPEEQYLDPFGQNPLLVKAALLRVANFMGMHAAIAHQHGVAVSLPETPEDCPESYWKPWRSVVAVERVDDSTHVERQLGAQNSDWETKIGLVGLALLQRCLVSRAFFPTQDESRYWTQLAEAVENLGYLVTSKRLDLRSFRELNASYELGKIVALLHAKQCIHGDLHFDNFAFKEDGTLESSFDFGRSTILDRPPTPLERASDLAVLKRELKQVGGFVQWEAVKRGYRYAARQEAENVLAFFDRPVAG